MSGEQRADVGKVANAIVYVYISVIVVVAVLAIVGCVVGLVIRKRKHGFFIIPNAAK